jgi:group I intron endonuclease
MFYVYRIKNKINGKSYIGITGRTIEERWQEHLSRAQCSQRYSRLYCAIRKYGKNNFIVNMIDCVSSEKKVRKLEGKYIKQYDSYRNGYNCNYGGLGHLFFSDDLRRKISNAQKGKIIQKQNIV